MGCGYVFGHSDEPANKGPGFAVCIRCFQGESSDVEDEVAPIVKKPAATEKKAAKTKVLKKPAASKPKTKTAAASRESKPKTKNAAASRAKTSA